MGFGRFLEVREGGAEGLWPFLVFSWKSAWFTPIFYFAIEKSTKFWVDPCGPYVWEKSVFEKFGRLEKIVKIKKISKKNQNFQK